MPSSHPHDARPTIACPADVLAILRRRRRLAIGVFLGVAAFATAAAVMMPKSYESEVVLLVRKGRESVGLDPSATTGGITSVYETREHELNSVLDILRSRTLLDAVVDRIGVDVVLDHRKFSGLRPIANRAANPNSKSNSNPDSKSESKPDSKSESKPDSKPEVPRGVSPRGVSGDSSLARQRAIKALAASIGVDNSKQSSVISVSAKAGSPTVAQAIATAFLDVFKREYLRVNQTDGSLEFFERQSEFIGKQLDQALVDFGASKNEIGIGTIEGQRGVLEQRLSLIDQDMTSTTADLAASTARLAALEAAGNSLPNRTSPNDASDATRRQLNQLRIREQLLLTKYTELHPLVIDVRRQVSQAEKLLADPVAGNAGNPSAREFELLIAGERATKASLAARMDTVRSQSLQLADELKRLNAGEASVYGLRERIEHLKTTWHSATRKLEEARLLHELAHDQISNVNVVQFPSFNPKSVGPGKSSILGLGIVLGVLSGIAAAVLAEFFGSPKSASASATQTGTPHVPGQQATAMTGLGHATAPGVALAEAVFHSSQNQLNELKSTAP